MCACRSQPLSNIQSRVFSLRETGPENPQRVSNLGTYLMAEKVKNPIITGTHLFALSVTLSLMCDCQLEVASH